MNIQDGYGVEKYPDGSIYKGDFKDGQKSGEGTFLWSDGSIYKGNFV